MILRVSLRQVSMTGGPVRKGALRRSSLRRRGRLQAVPRHVVRYREPLPGAVRRLHGQVLRPQPEAVSVGPLDRRCAKLGGRQGAVPCAEGHRLAPSLWISTRQHVCVKG